MNAKTARLARARQSLQIAQGRYHRAAQEVCPATFLGANYAASLFPAVLAASKAYESARTACGLGPLDPDPQEVRV